MHWQEQVSYPQQHLQRVLQQCHMTIECHAWQSCHRRVVLNEDLILLMDELMFQCRFRPPYHEEVEGIYPADVLPFRMLLIRLASLVFR